MTMPRLWLFLAVGLPVLAALIANLPSVDLAYHLRAGGEMLDGQGIPDRDTWTYTAAGAAWLDQQWGAQVILAVVERSFGWTGLVVLRAALNGIVFGSLAFIARQVGMPARWAALLTLAAFVVSAVALGLRPQLFGMAMFALVLAALTERHRHPNWLWAVPLLTILWANFHGSFFLAPLVCGLAWLQDVHDHARSPHRALLAAVVSALAACVTPFGPAIWVYAVGLSTNPEVTQRISEWQPTALRNVPGALFFGSALLVAALLARRGRTTDWPQLAWLAVFFAIGVYAIRGVAWWPLAAVPVVAAILATDRDFAGAHEPLGTPLMRRLNIVVVGLIAVIGIALLPVWRPIDPGTSAPEGVVGIAPSGITGALRDLAEPDDRLFHPQIWGSWFEYALPDLPVAIDSRIEVYPTEVWDDYEAVVDGREGWQDLLDGWGVTIVVTSEDQASFAERIGSAGWEHAFADDDGAVWIRSDRG